MAKTTVFDLGEIDGRRVTASSDAYVRGFDNYCSINSDEDTHFISIHVNGILHCRIDIYSLKRIERDIAREFYRCIYNFTADSFYLLKYSVRDLLHEVTPISHVKRAN